MMIDDCNVYFLCCPGIDRPPSHFTASCHPIPCRIWVRKGKEKRAKKEGKRIINSDQEKRLAGVPGRQNQISKKPMVCQLFNPAIFNASLPVNRFQFTS
jgi:hypothetical protein